LLLQTLTGQAGPGARYAVQITACGLRGKVDIDTFSVEHLPDVT
jgi:hypothetical protein